MQCVTFISQHPTGFAVNLQLLLSKPTAQFDVGSKQGHIEESLLKHLVTVKELEAKADDCSKVRHSVSRSMACGSKILFIANNFAKKSYFD